GTSDFRGTHSALLLLAKSLSLTLSHAPADGRQARRIPAVANPPVRPGAAGLSDAGSVVGRVLDGGLDVLEEFVDDGDAVGDPSLRAGEVDDEGPSAHSGDPSAHHRRGGRFQALAPHRID